jgi:uncharacterized protein (TIGR02246 family)
MTTSPPADRTADTLAILDLFARYAWGMDSRDEEAFASAWTDDAVWTASTGTHCEGKEAILANFRKSKSTALPEPGSAVRLFGHPMITFDGDQAIARTEMVAFRSSEGVMLPYSIGYYDDKLERTSGGWRLSKRDMVVATAKTPA